ncbi:MAG: hypothetical protein ACKPAJ_13165, partial [Actinomycetota bacterium]
MKTLRITCAIAIATLVVSSPALSANKEGAKCTTAGKIVKVADKKLVCVKSAKTLKWVALPAVASTTTTVAATT